jgi:threonine dehydratase
MAQSFEQKQTVNTDYMDTLADGIGVRIAIPKAVEKIQDLVSEYILVSEKGMEECMELLESRENVVSELAGAAGFAALQQLDDKYELSNKKVLCVVTGGNR